MYVFSHMSFRALIAARSGALASAGVGSRAEVGDQNRFQTEPAVALSSEGGIGPQALRLNIADAPLA
jgi:hypothetical protein